MITLSLPKIQEKKLTKVAQRYGFSVEHFLSRIVIDATRMLLDIPEESLDEYEHPERIKKNFRKAMQAQREGKLLSSLPKSLVKD